MRTLSSHVTIFRVFWAIGIFRLLVKICLAQAFTRPCV